MPRNANILIRLREMRNTLTPAEGRVADYVTANLDEIPSYSIIQLAERCKTSEASVIRFCHALDYKGYRDFVVSLSAAIGAIKPETEGRYTDIRPGDKLSTIISNISFNNTRSIEDTLSVLGEAQIARAVEMLRKAGQIDFYGVGASGIVCMDAQQKFMRINKPCRVCTDAHSQLTAAALLAHGDVAVLISNSGSTLDILDAMAVARASGAQSIAITRYARSPLAEQADCVLNISTPEITIRSGAMGSRIAMLNVVDILFAAVASAEYDKVQKYLDHTHEVLSKRSKA